MADTTLSPTGLVQPEVGASEDTWGGKLNDNFDILNDLLGGVVAAGVFTPTAAFATPGTSSFVYSTQTGKYVQVGKLVLAEVTVGFTPTKGTASGNLIIGTLPVAASSLLGVGSVIVASTITFPSGTTYLTPSFLTTTTLVLRGGGSGLGFNNAVATGNVTDGVPNSVVLSIAYIAA